MKLRAITLENVRRFGGLRAELRGIGDGLTVVAEANEFGKSTFFDALHALFFIKHGRIAAQVKSLRPHAKGPVTVSAEIDLPSGSFRVTKTFLERKMAEVASLPDGRVIARGGEADDWVEALLAQDGDGAGPTGLLWVRQGVLGLDSKDEAQRMARRDLLSSVAGEIEEVTGGRGMDRIERRAQAALAEIATTSQARPKGPRKEVEDALQTARNALEQAARDCADLTAALEGRLRARAELARLQDPAVTGRQQEALAAAQVAHDAATAHARKVEAAHTALRMAEVTETAARDRRDGLAAQIAAVQQAQQRLAAATEAQRTAETRATDSAQSLQRALAALENADTLRAEKAAALARVQRAGLIRRARQDVARLASVLADVDGHLDAARKARAAQSAALATPERLSAAEVAADALAGLQARAQEGAVHITARYDGTLRVALDGAKLAEGVATPVLADATLTLPGIGALHLAVPGSDSRPSPQEIERAGRALSETLAAMGVTDMAAARAAVAARATLSQDAQMAERLAATLAPQGRDALAAQLEAARAEAGDLAAGDGDVGGAEPGIGADPDLPPLSEASAQLDQAEQAVAACAGQVEAARHAQEQAAAALAAARATQDSEVAALDRAEHAAGPPAQRSAEMARLADAQAAAETAVGTARATRDALRATAPDPANTLADLTRAEAAIANSRDRRTALERDIAAFDARIATRAEDGVEERKAELEGEVARLQARADAYAEEVAALQLLCATLQEARSAARDIYFEPVQTELRPLLHLLHDTADLNWEDDALLPGDLRRDGVTEAFETLSGGTQEQIAILTRLAFARLYARSGRHIPVILDDALVFSDDDRIVKMFTALNRVAMEQQVIVFSCRQMAFAELGGARPTVQISPA